ncbi:MAG: Holliday junction resolvase RuvX [Bacteroidaceae bacterium]
MSRIMAIDYGEKRTGVAVTDPAQIIANGLTTVSTSELLRFIQDYIKKESVERFVIGQPKQMSGENSENAGRVISFISKLRVAFPDIPVESYDERFTSRLAHQTMLDGGLKKMARRNKALVDEISATIILQSYMESKRI